MSKKGFGCLTFILIFFTSIIIIALYTYNTAYYERNYSKIFDIAEDASYYEVIEAFGEPIEVVEQTYDNRKEVDSDKVALTQYILKYGNFDMMLILFTNGSPDITKAINSGYYVIYTDKYKIGREKLCVGDRKEHIREIYGRYRKTKYVKEESTDKTDKFYEYPTHIYFYYDDNDCVEKIEFYNMYLR